MTGAMPLCMPADAAPRPVAPRRGPGPPWLAGGISLALHAAALAAVLFLLPDALAPPAREQGVEILWQDVPEDSLATAEESASPAAPPSVAAPSAPEEPPLPLPQAPAASPPPRAATGPEAPPAPPRPPAPTLAEAPLASPPVRVPEQPPPAPRAAAEVPAVARLPDAAAGLAPPPAALPDGALAEPPPAPPPPREMAALPPPPAPEPGPPQDAMPIDAAPEPLPPPPPAMPPPTAPTRTAEARPAPSPPMRVTPGFGPVAPQGEAEREAMLAGASRVTGAVVPPGLLDGHRNPQPEYPAASRLRGEQGVVRLVLGVSASGQVASVEIGGSSGFPALDEAAKRAAQRWRFRPAMRDGKPVEGTIRTAVHFRLVQ